MKLISWNVNGMRSALKKGFLDWFRSVDPDVINLQEIRVEWEELDAATRAALQEKHEVCWFPSQIKKGYSGTATLTRKGLDFSHQKGLGIQAYDQEGRMILSKHGDFTLIAGYFPNASEGLVRLPFKQQFSRDLVQLVRSRMAAGEQIVLVGDMNVAPEEIDLANPQSNRKSPGFTDEERADFQEYLRCGLHDIHREQNVGVPKLYTWWSARTFGRARNVGWRIDMFLISDALLPKVQKSSILADVMGSDHCPILLEIDI